MLPAYHVTHGHRLLAKGVLEDLPACGRIAVTTVRRFVLRSGTVPVAGVVKLNGRQSQRGEPLICWSCGCPVKVDWLSYERPMVKRSIPNRSEIKEQWDRAV